MPPLTNASKSKGKTKDARRSRSRNTTPSSVISAGTAPVGATTTPLLDLDLSRLLVSSKPNYTDVTDYLESHGARVEPKPLHDIIEQLKHLSDSAEKRIESCEKAIRLIHEQKKEIESDHQDRERQAEQARRQKARKEESQKNTKAKKRKDRPETFDSVEIKREGMSSCRPGPLLLPSSLLFPKGRTSELLVKKLCREDKDTAWLRNCDPRLMNFTFANFPLQMSQSK